MKRITLLFTCFALMLLASIDLSAQCRTFVKNNCGEAMGEYIPGENFSAAKFMPGDEAELAMTFSKGEDYRLLVCTQPVLGDVGFKIKDAEGSTLYDSAEHEFKEHFDFRVPGTQELIVEVKVPDTDAGNFAPQGCIAILVGKKVTP